MKPSRLPKLPWRTRAGIFFHRLVVLIAGH